MVAGNHDRANARGAAHFDGFRDFGPRWIHQAYKAEECQLSLNLLDVSFNRTKRPECDAKNPHSTPGKPIQAGANFSEPVGRERFWFPPAPDGGTNSEQALRRSGVEGRDKDTKPVFVDLESYPFLEIFHGWLTKSGELEVTEMLPDPEHLLWQEKDGRRTFELRTQIVPR